MNSVFLRQLRECAAVMTLLAGFAAVGAAQTAGGTAAVTKPPASSVAADSKSTTRPEALLVFPFENAGRDSQMDWLGEGLAELANERLTGHGPTVFSREERLAALEKLGLPAYSSFSRATMLKIAGEIDADYVVFGEFTPDGQSLRVTARVLGINPPRLSSLLTESGLLDSLSDIEGRLSSRVLCEIRHSLDARANCDAISSVAQIPETAAHIRPDALEYFVHGLLISEDEARLRDLREAARLEPDWDDPLFVLGQTYYARRDCESAVGWFARVPALSAHAAEAGFDSGVCQLLRNDPLHAEPTFAGLVVRVGDSPEILSNLGAALLRQARYKEAAADFSRAEQLDPGEPDYWFNLGLADYLLANWAQAADSLREVVRLQPDSTDAHGLLAAALDHNGDSDEANALRQSASADDPAAQVNDAGIKQQNVAKMSPTTLAKLARIRMQWDVGAVR